MSQQPSRWLLVAVFLSLCGDTVAGQVQIPERLTLEEARLLLVKHSPVLGAAQAGIEAEASDVFSASRRPNPQFGFTSEGLDFESAGGGFFSDQEISLTLAYSIETAEKRRKRTRVQEAEVEIAEIDRRNLLRQLTFELKQAYFQIVLGQKETELARTVLENFDRILKLDRIRFEQGEISGRDLRRLEVERYRLLEELIAAEVQLQDGRDRLIALLGAEASGQPFEAVDSFDPTWRPVSAVTLKDLALENREDLRAQQARLARSAADVELQKARRVPDVTPFAGYRRDFGDSGMIAGVSLRLPVFDRNQGEIGRARAEKSREQWQLRFLELEILKEVRLALNQLSGNRRRLDRLETEYLKAAEESSAITETAYRLGSASLVEFLDAQQMYWETVSRYHGALYDFEISRARLELAVGKDLEP